MTDLDTAKQNLKGHSICLCRNGDYFFSDGRGISPMMALISEGRGLCGYSVADIIVGRAAAMLFVRSGIISVYGEVMSRGGFEYLTAHGIKSEYGNLTEKIINRAGDDICPMEKTVLDINDFNEGYIALKNRLAQMRAGGGQG